MDFQPRHNSGSWNRQRSGSWYSSNNGYLAAAVPMMRGGSLNSSSNTAYSNESALSFDDPQYASSSTTASHNNSPSTAITEEPEWNQQEMPLSYTGGTSNCSASSVNTARSAPSYPIPTSPLLDQTRYYSTSPGQISSPIQEDNISTLPPYDPAEGDPNIHWQMYYNQVVSKQESYWELKEGYTSSANFPVKRVDEKVFNENDKQVFPCTLFGCESNPFKRTWDLKRHIETHPLQPKDQKNGIYCDYRVCSSSRNKNPFDKSRVDHAREHYRDVHQEDLIKKNAKPGKDLDKWLDDRIMHESWWRCSKCLKRVRTSNGDYICDSEDCGAQCEAIRVAARKERFGYDCLPVRERRSRDMTVSDGMEFETESIETFDCQGQWNEQPDWGYDDISFDVSEWSNAPEPNNYQW